MDNINNVLMYWRIVKPNKYVSEDKEEDMSSKKYTCPRGHTFKTNNPIVIAVDGDTEYNSGPICGYCYVDWFKVNLNANEERVE
jgi:hypothetical protein